MLRIIKIALILVSFFYFDICRSQVYTNTPSSEIACTFGLTVTDLVKDSINYTPGILFNAGFVYNLTLSEKVNLGLELLYTGKGVKIEAPIIKYRYFYIDVPLYMQYKFNDNIRANIGAQYSVFTNSIVSQIDGSNPNGVNNIKYVNIKSTDYGFLLGTEIDLTQKATLTLRYTLSGSTFFEKEKANFGVFNVGAKINLYSTYRQFFGAKTVE